MASSDPKKVSTDIGFRISELRQTKGWTQEEFSVQLRSTMQWVSQIEAGRNLTIYTMVKIANALDVPLAELLMAPSAATPRRRGRPKKVT